MDRDSPGFDAPLPFLVPCFTLLGARNSQHCPHHQVGRLPLKPVGLSCRGLRPRTICRLDSPRLSGVSSQLMALYYATAQLIHSGWLFNSTTAHVFVSACLFYPFPQKYQAISTTSGAFDLMRLCVFSIHRSYSARLIDVLCKW